MEEPAVARVRFRVNPNTNPKPKPRLRAGSEGRFCPVAKASPGLMESTRQPMQFIRGYLKSTLLVYKSYEGFAVQLFTVF